MPTGYILTTTEAAKAAAVAPSTIKRWADQGHLPFVRTAGGHRRFERPALERLLRQQHGETAAPVPSHSAAWIRCLIDGRRHAIDGRLLEARERLGSWAHVADEVALALEALGTGWAEGGYRIAEEHLASQSLGRALARMSDALPQRLDSPRALLACIPGEEHTLGLWFAELCLRELGWTPLLLSRHAPTGELVRLIRGGDLALVALTASAAASNKTALRKVAAAVGAACQRQGTRLVLGGAGAWPDRPAHGVRLTRFAALAGYLASDAA